jgi:hypothetical protein
MSSRSNAFFTRPVLTAAALLFLTFQGRAADYSRWTSGLSSDATYFPIAVWLQNPSNAERYKAAGINLYVALSRGARSNQLALLAQAGMKAICSQNAATLEQRESPLIVGWMHGDEPDNAQSLGRGKGYGPPISPATVVSNYATMRAADPSRPVFLNLGQGVAWDNYIGRGVRRNHPEDYPEYIKGCDIASFDIYPVVHDHRDIAGKLEFVTQGVERLRQWSGGEKVVWNCIECSRISNVDVKPTPEQVRSEVWMSLIHGSQGIIYFVHQFKPTFKEAALLEDAEMLAGVTAINRQIHELAPVLNSPTLTDVLVVESKEVPVAAMVKWHENQLYVFTVCMRNDSTRCAFRFHGVTPSIPVEVLGESRNLTLDRGEFRDDFKPYEVHLYRLLRSSMPRIAQ